MASWQIYPLLAKICFNLTRCLKGHFTLTLGIGMFYKYRFPPRTKAESANATRVSKNIHLNLNLFKRSFSTFSP